MIIENAMIEKTFLGIEDHGTFTYILSLKYGSGDGQGFGMITLDTPTNSIDGIPARIGTSFGCQTIMDIIKTVGVGSWEEIQGKYIRIKRETKLHATIEAIGNILEDNWVSLV